MKKHVNKFLVTTLSTIVSGVVIGWLLAPEKRSELMKKAKQKGSQYLESARGELKTLNGKISERTAAAKESIGKAGETAKEKGNGLVGNAKKFASYDEWTKEELYQKAKNAGIENYSTMNKDELIEALRNK